jgi:hypothetical protein
MGKYKSLENAKRYMGWDECREKALKCGYDDITMDIKE